MTEKIIAALVACDGKYPLGRIVPGRYTRYVWYPASKSKGAVDPLTGAVDPARIDEMEDVGGHAYLADHIYDRLPAVMADPAKLAGYETREAAFADLLVALGVA